MLLIMIEYEGTLFQKPHVLPQYKGILRLRLFLSHKCSKRPEMKGKCHVAPSASLELSVNEIKFGSKEDQRVGLASF